MRLANSRIIQNTSGKGGGLYIKKGKNIEIINCEILRNKAEIDEGGGLFIDFDKTLEIVNSSICLNSAQTYGGGMSISGHNFTTLFSNTIIYHNKKISGTPDDYYHNSGYNNNSSNNCCISNSVSAITNLSLVNCIRTEPMFRDTAEIELTGTIEFTHYSRVVTGSESKFTEEVQIGDSIYLIADGEDYILSVNKVISDTELILSSRYIGDAVYSGKAKVIQSHLDLQSKSQGDANDSPCIDAGNNIYVNSLADIIGGSRIVDGDTNGHAIVDIGAREKQ